MNIFNENDKKNDGIVVGIIVRVFIFLYLNNKWLARYDDVLFQRAHHAQMMAGHINSIFYRYYFQ